MLPFPYHAHYTHTIQGIACNLQSLGYKHLEAASSEVLGAASKPYSLTGSLPLVGDLQAAGFDIQVRNLGDGMGVSSSLCVLHFEGVWLWTHERLPWRQRVLQSVLHEECHEYLQPSPEQAQCEGVSGWGK